MRIILFANTDWYLYNFRLSLLLALRDAGHDLLLVSPPGPHGHRLRALGFRWEPLPMERRSLHPLREAKLIGHLWRLFRRERADLVHAFTLKCAIYGSLAARLSGVPARVNAVAGMGYVFTSADRRARLLRPVVRALLKLALGGRGARLILQNPDDMSLFARARLVDRKTARLIPGSGVDCVRFSPRPEARPPSATGTDASLSVLLAARLLWDKGIAEYVDAARRLRTDGRAIRFMLAGDPDPGNPAAVPVGEVQAWVEEGLIEWLGNVDDMPGLLGVVDIVILPSYREGLPKGLIEAAACALPLVTTDVPGCREVVSNGVDGLLVPPRDGAALAAAIAMLHDDPELARRLGMAARAKALREFEESIVVGRTIAVYNELLAGSSRAMA